MSPEEQDEITKTECPHCRGEGWVNPKITWPPKALSEPDPLKRHKIFVMAVWTGCPICGGKEDKPGTGRVSAEVAATYRRGMAALKRLGAGGSPST